MILILWIFIMNIPIAMWKQMRVLLETHEELSSESNHAWYLYTSEYYKGNFNE